MYSPERVSTLIFSPWPTNSGTRTTAPVSSLAGLPPPPDVSPRTPGSVSVISSSTKIGGVTVSLSEALDPASATASAVELRAAGPDGLFDTADDVVIGLKPPSYTAGSLTLSYLLAAAPLPPGSYRLTVGTGLKDRAGNPLGAAVTRRFTVQALAGYTVEAEPNDATASATVRSPTRAARILPTSAPASRATDAIIFTRS